MSYATRGLALRGMLVELIVTPKSVSLVIEYYTFVVWNLTRRSCAGGGGRGKKMRGFASASIDWGGENFQIQNPANTASKEKIKLGSTISYLMLGMRWRPTCSAREAEKSPRRGPGKVLSLTKVRPKRIVY